MYLGHPQNHFGRSVGSPEKAGGGITWNFRTALGRNSNELIGLVNKSGHRIAHNFDSEQMQSLGATRVN
jgi:hypothetical protein